MSFTKPMSVKLQQASKIYTSFTLEFILNTFVLS